MIFLINLKYLYLFLSISIKNFENFKLKSSNFLSFSSFDFTDISISTSESGNEKHERLLPKTWPYVNSNFSSLQNFFKMASNVLTLFYFLSVINFYLS